MCYATLAVSITGMVLLYQTTFSDPGFVPVKLGDLNAVRRGSSGCREGCAR